MQSRRHFLTSAGSLGLVTTVAGCSEILGSQSAGSAQFVDTFESGSLENWELAGTPEGQEQDTGNWSTTRDALEGEWAAYCETTGDSSVLQTEEPVLDLNRPLSISFRWRTDAENSRGIDCMARDVSGGGGARTPLWTRVGLDVDGVPIVYINGLEREFSALQYGRSHTTEVRVDAGSVAVLLDGTEVISTDLTTSGQHRLAFNSSGHWGADSTMTVDSVRVAPL